jgi:hypothetical protein
VFLAYGITEEEKKKSDRVFEIYCEVNGRPKRWYHYL